MLLHQPSLLIINPFEPRDWLFSNNSYLSVWQTSFLQDTNCLVLLHKWVNLLEYCSSKLYIAIDKGKPWEQQLYMVLQNKLAKKKKALTWVCSLPLPWSKNFYLPSIFFLLICHCAAHSFNFNHPLAIFSSFLFLSVSLPTSCLFLFILLQSLLSSAFLF